MSTNIPLEDVQTKLTDLIAALKPGDEIVITQGNRPIAGVRPILAQGIPQFGRGKGLLIKEVNDDEHLQDFQEYMQ